MDLRKDALTAASACILEIEDEAKKWPQAVATVGQITAIPGGVNVVPGEVRFSIDMRNQKAALRDAMFDKCVERMKAVCAARGLEFSIEVGMKDAEGVPAADHIQDIIAESCKEAGYPEFRMPSGAGHDSSTFGSFCPMGMIFIRSKDGLSHNKDEYSSPEDCAAGAEVLYRSMLKLACQD